MASLQISPGSPTENDFNVDFFSKHVEFRRPWDDLEKRAKIRYFSYITVDNFSKICLIEILSNKFVCFEILRWMNWISILMVKF